MNKKNEYFNECFFNNTDSLPPLAERMRPVVLNEFVGQKHLISSDSLLSRAIKSDKLGSCIFWGPPGCGKTTLANIIANSTEACFEKAQSIA